MRGQSNESEGGVTDVRRRMRNVRHPNARGGTRATKNRVTTRTGVQNSWCSAGHSIGPTHIARNTVVKTWTKTGTDRVLKIVMETGKKKRQHKYTRTQTRTQTQTHTQTHTHTHTHRHALTHQKNTHQLIPYKKMHATTNTTTTTNPQKDSRMMCKVA